MVKHFRMLAAALSLLCSLPLFSNPIEPTQLNANTKNAEGAGCVWVSPISLQVYEIGTTHAKLSWTQPGAPPPYYNMKAIRLSDGTVLANFNFPFASSVTVPNLPNNTLIRFVLTPLCYDGTLSQFPAMVDDRTLILDLVVTGFNTSGTAPDGCELTAANQFCLFNKNQGTRFTVCPLLQYNAGRQFKIFGNGTYDVSINESNAGQEYKYYCQPDTDPGGSGCETNNITVKRNGLTIAEFTVIHTAAFPTKALLVCTTLASGYEIARLTSNGFAPLTDRKEDVEVTSFNEVHRLSASPNPFTTQLDVQIPFSTEENEVTLNLYDLQGRLVQSEQTPGGPQTRTISTENLLPGLYLLRVETGNRSETIKVMKTH